MEETKKPKQTEFKKDSTELSQVLLKDHITFGRKSPERYFRKDEIKKTKIFHNKQDRLIEIEIAGELGPESFYVPVESVSWFKV